MKLPKYGPATALVAAPVRQVLSRQAVLIWFYSRACKRALSS